MDPAHKHPKGEGDVIYETLLQPATGGGGIEML